MKKNAQLNLVLEEIASQPQKDFNFFFGGGWLRHLCGYISGTANGVGALVKILYWKKPVEDDFAVESPMNLDEIESFVISEFVRNNLEDSVFSDAVSR